MKSINKIYIVLVILLSLNLHGYACLPETVDGWISWCEENDVDCNVYTTAEDFYRNADINVILEVLNSLEYIDGYGNISGDPSTVGELYTKGINDFLAIRNLDDITITTQFQNMCVVHIMEYINHIYGGSISENTYMSDYHKEYGSWVIYSGVELGKIYEFVNKEFNTTSYTSVLDAITHGYVVMTDMSSDIPGSTHNVVIVGYTAEGDYIYMDPEVGVLKSADPSDFRYDYTIVITGNKNK